MCDSLVLNFNERIDLFVIKVLGQDLAGDCAIDITERLIVRDKQMIIPGELIETVGLMEASEMDKSLPRLVLPLFFLIKFLLKATFN